MEMEVRKVAEGCVGSDCSHQASVNRRRRLALLLCQVVPSQYILRTHSVKGSVVNLRSDITQIAAASSSLDMSSLEGLAEEHSECPMCQLPYPLMWSSLLTYVVAQMLRPPPQPTLLSLP